MASNWVVLRWFLSLERSENLFGLDLFIITFAKAIFLTIDFIHDLTRNKIVF